MIQNSQCHVSMSFYETFVLCVGPYHIHRDFTGETWTKEVKVMLMNGDMAESATA